jgi:hypothetical protein
MVCNAMELKKVTRSKFRVDVRVSEHTVQMIPWLESTFGTGSVKGTWRYAWGHWAKSRDNVHHFFFKKEEDATMFILRWTDAK